MRRTMKAMVLTDHGGLERYEWREDWPFRNRARWRR